MMALIRLILFVTTDIYEKVKIRRLKCKYEKTEMANLIKMLQPLRVYSDNKHFSKNS
jgi:hypothetical protein